ncbi:hypothetical protein OGM63_10625 [Plectonema radiosum NIES-515]|uniref:Uncharacterized protein n=1 Tax=Plectonema radiosum NIES-515 TaxID=2986073 RepID=A0ABT3AXW8_9CYAN|nr:hypothetical protein [Plectonema radiosum]MCV3213963.1 hypothetical protein [Plectonema radiosum NIES-515]
MTRNSSHHQHSVYGVGLLAVQAKKGGQKVKRVYVQQIIKLLNLEEWSNEDTEPEEQAD